MKHLAIPLLIAATVLSSSILKPAHAVHTARSQALEQLLRPSKEDPLPVRLAKKKALRKIGRAQSPATSNPTGLWSVLMAGMGMIFYLFSFLTQIGLLGTLGFACFLAGLILGIRARRIAPDSPLTIVGLVVNAVLVTIIVLSVMLVIIFALLY